MNARIGNISISGDSLSVYGERLVANSAVTMTNGGSSEVAVLANAIAAGGAVTENYAITLGPGKSYKLPAPPAGHRWYITEMSRGKAQRIVEETGVVGLLLFGFAGYGAVQAWRSWRGGRWRF